METASPERARLQITSRILRVNSTSSSSSSSSPSSIPLFHPRLSVRVRMFIDQNFKMTTRRHQVEIREGRERALQLMISGHFNLRCLGRIDEVSDLRTRRAIQEKSGDGMHEMGVKFRVIRVHVHSNDGDETAKVVPALIMNELHYSEILAW